ncbi:MAG TPA: DUF402 domain-containing protein [Tenericutes bacterium]|nr:DUF402 domain-containing protein [Mycoplasmatota bacterium]
MEKIKIGERYQIQCYKHNGRIHRSWNEAVVLDVRDDYVVFGNNRTEVIESAGNTWRTKEPAIMYFFKNRWFNIIAQMKKDGIYYYCNIATPYIIEDKTIKYIDYDLDLRIYPTGDYKVLDKMEYKYHKELMSYSSELDKSIKIGLDDLINEYNKKSVMFDKKENMKYLQQYIKLKSSNKV